MTLFHNQTIIKTIIDNPNENIFSFSVQECETEKDVQNVMNELIEHYCEIDGAIATLEAGDYAPQAYSDKEYKKMQKHLNESLKMCTSSFGTIILDALHLATGAMDSSGLYSNYEDKEEETLTIKFIVPKSRIE